MFITRNFTFLHIMKTGGTWILRAVQDVPGLFLEVRSHAHFSTLPAHEAKSLPVFAITRNPWDWYVSMYFYLNDVVTNKRQDFRAPYHQLDPGRQAITDLYKRPFEEVMLSETTHRRELYQQLRDFTLREDGLHEQIEWLRFEDGTMQNFFKMCALSGTKIPPNKEVKIRKKNPINVSQHKHYSHYYTNETVDAVAKLEASTIERFGYDF
jgi:hypothetical protein